MNTMIFTEVHLLAGKLVLVVAIHSLRGSLANSHQTPNPHLGAAQPTQDKNPQDTRNPLELPLALRWGRHKNPSQSTGGGQEQSPTLANSPPLLQAI